MRKEYVNGLLNIMSWDLDGFRELVAIIENFELDFDDVIKETKNSGLNNLEMESYYNITLKKVAEEVKVVLKYHYPEYKREIEGFDVENYSLRDYSLRELKQNEELREAMMESILIRE
jgi:hypothetical protein